MTNPPVPATPLDVEACVRLLREAADLFAERARSAEPWEAAASNLKSATMNVLALALPGMGKDSDGWKHALALSADLTSMANARDAWRLFGEHVAHCVECGETSYEDCDEGSDLFKAAEAADDVLDHPIRSAARVAQPKREDRLRDWTDAVTFGPYALWMTRAHAEKLALEDAIAPAPAGNEWHPVPLTEAAYFALKERVITEQDAARAAQPEETSADVK